MKMNDGTVYGPADLNRLQTWTREGRVAPSSQISSDRKSWIPASQMPELGMEWVVEVEQGQYYGPFHPDVVRDLIAQKRVPASARRFKLDTGRAQEDHSKELNAALEKAKSSLAEKDASLAKEKALVAERESALEKAKASLAEKDAALAKAKALVAERESALEKAKASLAEKDAALAEQKAALKAEHVRVENLLAQLVSAAEREKALRADLDLAHKTAASERKCVEAAIRRERQTAKELEGARKDAEDLRVKMQKAKEQSKATKGKGGLFQGASAADLAFLEQAARRELASARGRSASVPRPQPKALDVIDV